MRFTGVTGRFIYWGKGFIYPCIGFTGVTVMPKGRWTNLTVPVDLYVKLKEEAEKRGIPIYRLIELMLAFFPASEGVKEGG